MVLVSTEIEIAAPPEVVREVFLAFSAYPEWHQGHFKSIEVTEQKDKSTIQPGDKLKVVLDEGLSFSPVVQENSEQEFRWRGSLPGVFTGTHSFRFAPSTATPGGTTLHQSEDFSGMLSFTMKPSKKSGQTNLAGFEKFNADIKAKAESQASAQEGT